MAGLSLAPTIRVAPSKSVIIMVMLVIVVGCEEEVLTPIILLIRFSVGLSLLAAAMAISGVGFLA